MLIPRLRACALCIALLCGFACGGAAAKRWRLETMPTVPGQQSAAALAISCWASSGCVAAGGAGTRHIQDLNLVERWSRMSWSLEQTPRPPGDAGFMAIDCLGPRSCMGVGGSARGWAEQLRGRRWRAAALPRIHRQPMMMQGVSCWANGGCMAVGGYGPITNMRPLAELWNGRRWTAEALPPPPAALDGFLWAVSCAGARDCIAVGNYGAGTGRGGERALAERWNGARWNVMAVPSPRGDTIQLRGISCPSVDWCEAAGSYEHAAQGTFFGLLEHWDGRRWRRDREPAPSFAPNMYEFLAISCTAPGSCTAVGDYGDRQQNSHVLADRLHGGRWAPQTPPSPPGFKQSGFDGVSCTAGGDCVAVGSKQRQDVFSPSVQFAERYS